MLHFLIHRPIAVLLSFLAALALGLLAGRTLPVSLLPDIPIPRISVQIQYEESAARELEQTIVQPLRARLMQVGGLEDLRSTTRDGAATIELFFKFGVDTDLAFLEVNEQLDRTLGQLPRDLTRPQVIKANVSDIPVFNVLVLPRQPLTTAEERLQLAEFTRNTIKRRIEQLATVAFVDLSGFAEPEIRVYPRYEKLRALGIPTDRIAQLIQVNNLNLGSILLQDGYFQYNLRFRSGLRTVADIEDLYFQHEGRTLQLRDIAEVTLGALDPRGVFLHNGREGIALTVRKQADARLFDLEKEFRTLQDALAEEYTDLDFVRTNDQTTLLRVSIDNLLSSLLYGAAFAFIILLLFFREWRSPILIALAVPAALVLALLGFYFLELSVNTISLAGLILGVGLMIDNSIIVMENIRQQRRMGYPLAEACVRGGNEVIRPLISSALTTCSVFLPLIFLSGLAGALFYDQAVSIALTLTTSLVVAFLFLPVVYRLLLQKKPAPQEAESKGYGGYIRSVDLAFRGRWLVLALFLGTVIGGYFLARDLPTQRFPQLSREALAVDINWGTPIDLTENRRRCLTLLNALDTLPQASDVYVGEEQFLLESTRQALNEARLVLYAREGVALAQIEARLQQFLAEAYPKAVARITPLANVFDQIFGASDAPLVAQIQMDESRQWSRQALLDLFQPWFGQRGLPLELPPDQVQYELVIDTETALRYGLTYEQIYQRLLALFNRAEIDVLRRSDRFVPILFGEEPANLRALLQQARLRNEEGREYPLPTFVELRKGTSWCSITADRRGEHIALDLPAYRPEYLDGMRSLLAPIPGLTPHFTGQYYANRELQGELLFILLISIGLLYLILAAQFESLRLPLVVILTVPVGLAGSVAALHLGGQSLNLVSMVGMIVMGGIVVNDAILKVDMMRRFARDLPLVEAAHRAGIRRLRPILMTTFTTILAVLPILFSEGLGAELQRPLAWAIIGGLSAGTVASVYLIPLLFQIFAKRK